MNKELGNFFPSKGMTVLREVAGVESVMKSINSSLRNKGDNCSLAWVRY